MSTKLFQVPSFLLTSNIYEVNVRQYTPEGTFKAFSEHLPRLHDMGVEICWFMPIHEIGIQNRKGTLGSYYSVKDYKSVNHEFGTLDDFKNLVVAAHALGMKVIIDWVANHTAWDNEWANVSPDFYVKNEDGSFYAPHGWDDVIQINHANEAQQNAMIDAMQFWVREFNIDGFRADLAHLTPLPFWLKARTTLSTLKKDLIWLAETEDTNYHEAFDISYTWEWMHTTEKFAKNEISLQQLSHIWKQNKDRFALADLRMYFTSNHDENSWNGTEYEKYGMLSKCLAVLSCTIIGIPLIYSGQEIPNNKRLAFFDKDLIDFSLESTLHIFYKSLLSLRKRNKIYADHLHTTLQFEEKFLPLELLVYKLKNDPQEVIVAINMNRKNVEQTLIFENISGTYVDVFTDKQILLEGSLHVNIQAGSFLVLEKIS